MSDEYGRLKKAKALAMAVFVAEIGTPPPQADSLLTLWLRRGISVEVIITALRTAAAIKHRHGRRDPLDILYGARTSMRVALQRQRHKHDAGVDP